MGMEDMPNPTRMELLKIKDRIALAKKGHKLLKQKRDALILEFFKIIKKSKDIRGQINARMKSAYLSIAVAKAHHSMFDVKALSLANARQMDVDIEVKNVMGVKIPNLTLNIEKREYPMKGYSLSGTSVALEHAVESYEQVLDMALQLAETEIAIKRLIMEIEKTKRRVNSLEFIMLPSLENQMKVITLKLDELERDGFVSLKVIKRKLEREAAQNSN
ncbi:V-type ATP synthase subunit D [Candidatus Micrarchaeota archaeon]|nr:V-type ATP synthase subunit D [Candidatus Micrarchaeota archaeon]